MAQTLTLIEATPNSVAYTVAEAATAAAALTSDISGDLVAGPLQDALFPTGGFASQAAARTAWDLAIDIIQQCKINTPAGATGGALLTVDQNVAGVLFRLVTAAIKDANGDVATWVLRISHRHSIID
jgi:hypothetical protein